MQKKETNFFDKALGRDEEFKPKKKKVEPEPPKKIKAEKVFQMAPGERYIMILHKGGASPALHRYYKRPIPQGKWFKGGKGLLAWLQSYTSTHNIIALPVGMHPGDIEIEE